MKITNKWGAPLPLVKLAENDDYSRGAAHVSVTQIIGPPKIDILNRKYDDQIEMDVGETAPSLLGRAVHAMAQRGAEGLDDHIAEQRLFTEVGGWTLSGGMDLQRQIHIEKIEDAACGILDYKCVGAYAVMNNKWEWEAQLNLYALLVRRTKNWDVRWLKTCAIVRDLNRRDVKNKKEEGYPQSWIWTVPVTLWPVKEQERYMLERIRIHQDARRAFEWGDPMPDCTSEERWMRSEKWELRKTGRKTPVKVFHSGKVKDPEKAATAELIKFTKSPKTKNPELYHVQYVPGEPIRCNEYCKVAPWCEQAIEWEKEFSSKFPTLL